MCVLVAVWCNSVTYRGLHEVLHISHNKANNADLIYLARQFLEEFRCLRFNYLLEPSTGCIYIYICIYI